MENKTFLDSIPIFQTLTDKQKDSLVSAFSRLEYLKGETIINEGDFGDLLYIIKEGTVKCYVRGIELRILGKGEYFGEQALLDESPRSATVVADCHVKCISIGRDKLVNVLGSNLRKIIHTNSIKIAIYKSPILKKLSNEQVKLLVANMKIKIFNRGETIIDANTPKFDNLILILKGKAGLNKKVTDRFECLGDEEIANNRSSDIYENNLIASEETHIAIISRVKMLNKIGEFSKATLNNKALSVIKKIHLFRGLSIEKLKLIIDKFTVEEFQDSQIIVEQNTLGDSFFIIKSGTVDVIIDANLIRSITKLDYFGERSMLLQDTRSASVVANGKVSCWVLKKSDFLEVIDENIRLQLLKRIHLQDDNIELSHLVPIKLLGKGMYGNVFLACNKVSRALYALKTVQREKIIKYHMQENLIQERSILRIVDHTFILKLIRTFKDQSRIYFLLEFIRGMDLFDVLREMNLVSDSDAIFFTACIIIILEHLHERDIVYRDLKPENIMVDEDGYLKIIDFGTAKIVKGRTFTVVGTPHYMAPEIIVGKGYDYTVDY